MAALGKSLLLPAKKPWTGSRKCWHCGKQLQLKAGGGYYFALIKDPLGNELRTHMGCVKDATGGGYTEVAAIESDRASMATKEAK